jgi:hypothetical protein
LKRGEGISMGVIVVAAIALVVLVILTVLVLRAGGMIGRGTSCISISGAQCVDGSTGEGCPDGMTRDVAKDTTCTRKEDICCIPSPVTQA